MARANVAAVNFLNVWMLLSMFTAADITENCEFMMDLLLDSLEQPPPAAAARMGADASSGGTGASTIAEASLSPEDRIAQAAALLSTFVWEKGLLPFDLVLMALCERDARTPALTLVTHLLAEGGGFHTRTLDFLSRPGCLHSGAPGETCPAPGDANDPRLSATVADANASVNPGSATANAATNAATGTATTGVANTVTGKPMKPPRPWLEQEPFDPMAPITPLTPGRVSGTTSSGVSVPAGSTSSTAGAGATSGPSNGSPGPALIGSGLGTGPLGGDGASLVYYDHVCLRVLGVFPSVLGPLIEHGRMDDVDAVLVRYRRLFVFHTSRLRMVVEALAYYHSPLPLRTRLLLVALVDWESLPLSPQFRRLLETKLQGGGGHAASVTDDLTDTTRGLFSLKYFQGVLQRLAANLPSLAHYHGKRRIPSLPPNAPSPFFGRGADANNCGQLALECALLEMLALPLPSGHVVDMLLRAVTATVADASVSPTDSCRDSAAAAATTTTAEYRRASTAGASAVQPATSSAPSLPMDRDGLAGPAPSLTTPRDAISTHPPPSSSSFVTGGITPGEASSHPSTQASGLSAAASLPPSGDYSDLFGENMTSTPRPPNGKYVFDLCQAAGLLLAHLPQRGFHPALFDIATQLVESSPLLSSGTSGGHLCGPTNSGAGGDLLPLGVDGTRRPRATGRDALNEEFVLGGLGRGPRGLGAADQGPEWFLRYVTMDASSAADSGVLSAPCVVLSLLHSFFHHVTWEWVEGILALVAKWRPLRHGGHLCFALKLVGPFLHRLGRDHVVYEKTLRLLCGCIEDVFGVHKIKAPECSPSEAEDIADLMHLAVGLESSSDGKMRKETLALLAEATRNLHPDIRRLFRHLSSSHETSIYSPSTGP
eukprot:jgi/Mesvir1/24259/Mv10961-RA.1